MLILREDDIVPILKGLTRQQCQDLANALRGSLESYSRGGEGNVKLIHQPMREQILTAKKNTTLFMPASDTNTTTGVKTVTLPGGGGAPKGAINVFAPEGDLDGVLNAELITAFRTALAAMVPFARHRLPDGANVVVFGAGKQAEWHIRLSLLLAHEKIAKVTVVNRGRAGLEKLRALIDAEVAPLFPKVSFDYCARESADADAEELVRSAVSLADAMFCCTPSTQPLFPNSYLQRGAVGQRFISLIGSYKPHMQEIDGATLLSGEKILVDSREACLAEAGELIMAGVRADQLVEVGELPSDPSQEASQEPSKGNTVFKCVGMGIMDLVVGRQLLRTAREKGVGVEVDNF